MIGRRQRQKDRPGPGGPLGKALATLITTHPLKSELTKS